MDKDAYLDKMKAEVDQWKAEMAKLRAQVDQAEAERRIETKDAIENAEVKIRELEGRMRKIKNANEEAWDEIKESVQSAYDKVRKAVSDAVSG